MAYSSITAWQIDGETVADFIKKLKSASPGELCPYYPCDHTGWDLENQAHVLVYSRCSVNALFGIK